MYLSVPDGHNHTMVVPTVLRGPNFDHVWSKLVPFGTRVVPEKDLHPMVPKYVPFGTGLWPKGPCTCTFRYQTVITIQWSCRLCSKATDLYLSVPDLHSLITASSRHTSVTQGSQFVPFANLATYSTAQPFIIHRDLLSCFCSLSCFCCSALSTAAVVCLHCLTWRQA